MNNHSSTLFYSDSKNGGSKTLREAHETQRTQNSDISEVLND